MSLSATTESSPRSGGSPINGPAGCAGCQRRRRLSRLYRSALACRLFGIRRAGCADPGLSGRYHADHRKLRILTVPAHRRICRRREGAQGFRRRAAVELAHRRRIHGRGRRAATRGESWLFGWARHVADRRHGVRRTGRHCCRTAANARAATAVGGRRHRRHVQRIDIRARRFRLQRRAGRAVHRGGPPRIVVHDAHAQRGGSAADSDRRGRRHRTEKRGAAGDLALEGDRVGQLGQHNTSHCGDRGGPRHGSGRHHRRVPVHRIQHHPHHPASELGDGRRPPAAAPPAGRSGRRRADGDRTCRTARWLDPARRGDHRRHPAPTGSTSA